MRDHGDERDEVAVIADYERRLDEFRAEVSALRTVLRTMESSKHRTALVIDFLRLDGKARWVVTAPTFDAQRDVAEAIGRNIAEQFANGVHLHRIAFTGSSREVAEKGAGA